MAIPVRNALDLGLNQIVSGLVENLTADPTPSAAMEGRVIYRTDLDKFKVCTGGAWQAFYLDTTRLDQITAPTASVSLNSQKITNLLDGTTATDAVNKGQLDAARAGLDLKDSVLVASTGNQALTSTGDPVTIDGVSLGNGDRVLLKNQSTGSQNGIYTWSASGGGTFTRATDADSNAEVTPGMFVFVEKGTANADTGWVLTNDTVTLGTTALTFSKFSAAATGIAKASGTITGDGVLTSFSAAHNLGTTAHTLIVWKVSDNKEVLVEKQRGANTDTIVFGVAPVNTEAFDWVATG
jgi:hypothetical protein